MKLTTSDAFKKLNSKYYVELTNNDIKHVQKKLLEILDDIINICNEKNIKYALCGGSALGAVRHKGFIPWDDDIDICMPRRDYERFVTYFREKYGNKYWIHTPEETEGYALLMSKIRYKNTVYRTRDDYYSSECGIYIDIFVVENAYKVLPLRILHGIETTLLCFFLSCRKFYRDQEYLLNIAKGNNKLLHMIKVKSGLGKILANFGDIDAWRKYTIKKMSKCKNDNSRYVYVPSGTFGFLKETFLRNDYCRYRTEEFEGRLVNIPIGEEIFFERCYGNWKQIPDRSTIEKHCILELKI